MTMNNAWWRGAVLYQIYPRSFKDSNNDGVGDLKGIIGKLDYIASLGVEGVWLSPFFKSPMADFGYDVEDYCAIDPLFGSMQDFDALLEGMHNRGLKLIIDLVLNHTAITHPWFVESHKNNSNPKADWYVWADAKPDGTPPNNWLSVFGGPAWTFDTRRGQYYYHQFLKEQPDLNVRNPEVQDALLGIVKFWLDKGVDGFRLDAVNHCIHDAQLRDNPPKPPEKSVPDRPFKNTYDMQWHKYDKSQPENLAFLRRLRALTDKYDARMMVAEIGDDHNIERCLEYTGPGMLHTAYSFSLLVKNYGAKVIRDTVGEFKDKAAQSWPSWAFSNHDVVRVASRWAINDRVQEAQTRMLQALLCSLWGTVFVYQGEELGLSDADVPFEKLQDPFSKFMWPVKGRDGCRTPMPWEQQKPYGAFSTQEPWLPMPEDHLRNAVDVQEKNKTSALHFFRSFVAWRKKHQALIRGDIRFLETEEPLLVFVRETPGEKILVACNMGDQKVSYTLPEGTKVLEGHGLPHELADNRLTLPPFGGFFGQLK
jgi:alpha-glucosidase